MNAILTKEPVVEYEIHDIKSIQAQSKVDAKTKKRSITGVTVADRPVDATPRFWNSLYSRFGFGNNVFNYFSPEEVFDRIAEKRPDENVRFCLYTAPGAARPTLLATSNPRKPVLEYARIRDVLSEYDPLDKTDGDDGIKYANGIMRASFTPRGEAPFEVGGDAFEARFDTMIPIDGYGSPEVALGCLRLVCTNGMVAVSKVFSSKIPGGNDEDGGINRIVQTIEGYGNDEGFDALRRRMETATESYASVSELQTMCKAVTQALGARKSMQGSEARELLDRMDRLAGNPMMAYGLLSNNAVSQRKLQTLPTRATVYDLMNFGTEVATHHVQGETGARSIYGAVGSMLGREYDLEGSAKDGQDFIDVFMKSNDQADTEAKAELVEELASEQD